MKFKIMNHTSSLLKKTYIFLAIILLVNCRKENVESNNTIQNISGYVQKGPFINGSSVTIYDLQSNLVPTGKSYNTQIVSNTGEFSLSEIALSSNYISLKADGFYFNEISGNQSISQITLYALADISSKTSINVNLLTNLEKARVEFLLKSGKSFSDAKIQAQKEILAIFNIEKTNIKSSENLNLSESGDDNGILLSVTSILQGFRSESELTELLSNISNDMKEDGILNSAVLGSTLISQAVYLDTTGIKNNLVKRYSDIGATAKIPNFGKHISNFISNSKFVINQDLISYPTTGQYGDNILLLTKTNYIFGQNNLYSLTAHLPKGTSLKIKITSLSYPDSTNTPSTDSTKIPPSDSIQTVKLITKPLWYYMMGSGQNWRITDFDFITYTQTFTAIESDKSCDLQMFFDRGSFLIEYYEMNSNQATRQKTIIFK